MAEQKSRRFQTESRKSPTSLVDWLYSRYHNIAGHIQWTGRQVAQAAPIQAAPVINDLNRVANTVCALCILYYTLVYGY